jgi:hypothetical protein
MYSTYSRREFAHDLAYGDGDGPLVSNGDLQAWLCKLDEQRKMQAKASEASRLSDRPPLIRSLGLYNRIPLLFKLFGRKWRRRKLKRIKNFAWAVVKSEPLPLSSN